MMSEFNKKILDAVRKTLPNKIAEELINVQPIDSDDIKTLYENSVDESELIEKGFEPIDNNTKLIWVKKDE